MRTIRPVCLLLLALLAAGCALPPPPYPRQHFVPNDEIDTVSLTREGLYYFSRSRFVDAEFRFRQALWITPGADSVRFNLAVTLANENSFAEAEELFEELLEQDPESSKVLAGMARMYVLQGDHGRARASFQRGLELALQYKEYERAAKFARSLAVLEFTLGREQDARCYSEFAMDLYQPPPPSDAVYRHGRLLVAVGQPAQAQALVSSVAAEREVKSDPALLSVLALAQFARGDFAETLSLSEAALDTKTTDRGLANGLQLLRYAAKGMLAPAAGAETADEEQAEEEAKAGRKLLQDAYNGRPLESGSAIYWPLTLLEYLEGRQLELEQEE